MKSIPNHVGIIMDGNGRWAGSRGQARCSGHSAGTDAVKRTVSEAKNAGVKTLSLFAFSRDNWQRNDEEIFHIFTLFSTYLKSNMSQLIKEGVALQVIGETQLLPTEIRNEIVQAEAESRHGDSMKLLIGLNYSGKWDIVQAINRCMHDYENQAVPVISEKMLEPYLANCSPVDLLIRTGGELRVSNFFLWQLAYTELYFTDTCWPDFDAGQLQKALDAYAKRKRTYGKVPSILPGENIAPPCPVPWITKMRQRTSS